MSVYLDYNATAPVRPEAIQAMVRALELGGNPSSVHAQGRAARAVLETARASVAALVGAGATSLIFVSGGTEANGLAIASAVRAGHRTLILNATEHDSILSAGQASGMPLETLPVLSDGQFDLGWLEDRLAAWPAADRGPFVSLMLANNETGVLQPVEAAARLVRQAGGWLHVDAAQAAGKVGIDFRTLGASTMAVSAHKLGGPQGSGALVFTPDVTLVRQQHGGGQERGRRAGTENLPGIAGFGVAAEVARQELGAFGDQALWRDQAQAELMSEGAIAVGSGASRLANTLCVALPGMSSELQVMSLDLAGVMVSAGSACSSGKVKASHVLNAMGLTALADCAIRVSGGWATTEGDWAAFVAAWTEMKTRHFARHRATAA